MLCVPIGCGDKGFETDVHNMAICFGRGVTPSDDGNNEAQECSKQMMSE